MSSWPRIEQTKGETEKRNSMNESEKMNKASRNSLNGDTFNIVGAWSLAVIFLTLGTILMLNVAIYGSEPVGLMERSTYVTEWLNQSDLSYFETVEGFIGGVVWSENDTEAGYAVSASYRAFLLPIRFLIALVFLLLGAYIVPKAKRSR